MSVPELIGRYPVRRLLGVGGFAVVWLAHDDRLDDEVAIKVLADNYAHRLDLQERFTQEARLLRRTTSQNLVEVFDIDRLPDGRPYFVMTYADGGSLADIVERERIPVDEALWIGAQAAQGVQDLHAGGILHRDVKPSNILLRTVAGGARRVLVADLGLSRELARGSRLTLTAGTPGYMAPEVAEGDGPVDQRADVYGLGATVYFALTGQEPTSNSPTTPSKLRHDLPPGTDEVLLRALAKDPESRWPTARAFAEALAALRDNSGVTQPAPPSSHPRRRHRAVLIAAALVSVLALTTAILLTRWLGDSANPTTDGTRPTDAVPSGEAPPLPGTRTRCAVSAGQDHYECFLHNRGNMAYLLDFYSHDYTVVLWGLKPDDDTYAFSQRWQFWWQPRANAFLIYNEHSDRCLTVDMRSEVAAPMNVAPCVPDDPSQLWHWTDDTTRVLRNQHGTCLDTPAGTYEYGTRPFTDDCDGDISQQWVLRPT